MLLTGGDCWQAESRFFSDPPESLQVGALVFPAGSKAAPHMHRPKHVEVVYPVGEMLFVLKGRAKASIYDEMRELVEVLYISAGDILLCKRGGHGYEFPETTRVLDIRCGPYVDKATDKEMIE